MFPNSRSIQVAVSGGASCNASVAHTAEALGAALAEIAAVVVCGGLGGVMEAVARGARQRGGFVVGILPGYDRAGGNPFLSVAVPTGLGHARNVLVAAAGDVLVALPGEAGTLSEIAVALKLGRQVLGLTAWRNIDGVEELPDVASTIRRIQSLTGADPVF